MTDSGDAHKFQFGIQQIRIGDHTDVDIGGPGTVTVVVGGNNVGKSTLLAQIHAHLMNPRQVHGPRLVTEISLPWISGDSDDLIEWIRATRMVRTNHSGQLEAHAAGGQPVPLQALAEYRNKNMWPGSLIYWFVLDLSRDNGMNAVDPQPRPQETGAPPANAMQYLHFNRDALDALARITKTLFGFDLYLDRIGINMALRIGQPDAEPYDVNSHSEAFDAAVATLPLVREQGHGIRAALSILVSLIAGSHPLILVDEPEAYLHPPQAHIIGSEIGKQAKRGNKQVIAATHDRNILRGIIESDAPVTIIHLTRDDNMATVNVLNPSAVQELWKDPALRYTNALDGLFHSAVIIAEDDRDAHFYNAAIDYVQSADGSDAPGHNLMFLGSSGKTNMARIVGGLHTLGVRVVSCPDLDVLRDEHVIRALVTAHGGDWGHFADDYKRATQHVRQAPEAPTVKAVAASISEIFSATTEVRITKELSKAVSKAALAPSTGWGDVKKYGVDALNADREATIRLLDNLDQLGIVAVRVGELERFVTTTNKAKGKEFNAVAFAAGAHTQPRAVEHATRLIKAAGIGK